MLKRESSSYRDPDGYIAYENDDVYRCVTNSNAPVTLSAYQDFFKKAVKDGLLVSFEKSENSGPDTDRNHTYLKLEKLPLVTYPYEWGFEQLKEAALVTLDICLMALDYGLTLKDATAFNIQQYEGRMVFIDHTSFEPSENMLPWLPYSQFCRHFLAPLLIISRRGHNANKRFRTELDGVNIEEASIVLPLWDKLKPSVFFHIYLHSLLIKNHQNDNAEASDPDNKRKKKAGYTGSQKAYIEHLKRVVQKIRPPKYDTEWHNYYNETNYQDASFAQKETAIKKIAFENAYNCVWDIGGNNGHFSRIISDHAQTVLSMDIDYAAIDLNFIKNRAQNKTNIYPIVMDITNPSPALGIGNSERTVINERSQPDLVVGLALIHHLTITYNIPFRIVAKQLHRYGADLLIEYVDRDDSQFKKLIRNKSETYDHYNQTEFETCFLKYFDLIEKTEIAGSHRCLYHLRRK